MLNIHAAYKAVEILKNSGGLTVVFVEENKFMATSEGYSCFGHTALEATLKLFLAKHPNIALNFFNPNETHGWR